MPQTTQPVSRARHGLLGRALILLLISAAVMSAGPVVNVYPSIGPNPMTSAYWFDYAAFAVYALEHGLTHYGDPAYPSYYSQTTGYSAGELIGTAFESWKGQTPPPAGFEFETGNAILFGLAIDGDGETFGLAGITYSESFLGTVAAPWSFAGEAYGYDLVGINYGPDGIRGTADDIRYDETNPGDDSVPVHALYFAGMGAFYAVNDPAELPAALDDVSNAPERSATGGYLALVGTQFVSGSATASEVPEPAAFALTGAGLLFAAAIARRRRQR